MTATLSYDSAKSLFSGHILKTIHSVITENTTDVATAQKTIESEIEQLDSYLSRFGSKVPAFHKKAVKSATDKRNFLLSMINEYFSVKTVASDEVSRKNNLNFKDFLHIPHQVILTDTFKQKPISSNLHENVEADTQESERSVVYENNNSPDQNDLDTMNSEQVKHEQKSDNSLKDQSEQIKEIYEQTRIDHIAYLLDKFSEYHAQGKGLAHQDDSGNDYQLFYRPKEDEPFKFYHYKNDEIEKFLSFSKARHAINYFAELVPSFGSRPDLPENAEDCKNKYFYYEATARPIGLGTTPKDYVRFEKNSGFGSVVFDRPLTKEELNHFDLKPLRYADKNEEQKEETLDTASRLKTSENTEEKELDNIAKDFKVENLNEIPEKLKSDFEEFKNTTTIQKNMAELKEYYLNTVLPSYLKSTQDQLERKLHEDTDSSLLHIGNIGHMEKLKAKQKSQNRGNVTYLYYNVWGEDKDGNTYYFREIGPYKYPTNPTAHITPEKVKSESKKNRIGAKVEKDSKLWALEEIRKKQKPSLSTKQAKTTKKNAGEEDIESLCKKEFGSHLVSATVESHINEGLSKDEAIEKTKIAINEIVQNGIPEKHIESIKNANKIKKKQETEKLTTQKGKSIYYYIMTEDNNKNQTYLFKTEPYHFLTSNLEEQKEARAKATEIANLWLVACRTLNSQEDLKVSNTTETSGFINQEQDHSEGQLNDSVSLT